MLLKGFNVLRKVKYNTPGNCVILSHFSIEFPFALIIHSECELRAFYNSIHAYNLYVEFIHDHILRYAHRFEIHTMQHKFENKIGPIIIYSTSDVKSVCNLYSM